jgi:YidC/Oxa1 family membrane protein insertase
MDAFVSPLASLLAFFYEYVFPSYGLAIILLTLTVMVALLPLTVKGTRSMLALQRLAPELRKLQEKHKNDRQKLQEESMALYRDNKIHPLGGCLPLLLQMPVFLLLYQVINGLARETNGEPDPRYLDESSRLYNDLIADDGSMVSAGVNLAQSAVENHGSFAAAIPFYLLIVVMVLVQYWQQHQVASRAPANDSPSAQQMKIIQKVFPPFFGLISLNFPAGVVLYWLFSSLFRVAQQWAMYRFDPHLKRTVASAKAEAEGFLSEKDPPRAQKKPGPSTKPAQNRSNKKKKRKGK